MKSRKKTRKLKIYTVGVDMSLTDTGLAILNSKGVIVSAISIKSNNKHSDMYRQTSILKTVLTEIDNQTAMAKTVNVFIEGYAYSRNQGKSFTRAELVGMLKLAVTRNHKMYTITPKSVKRWVSGNGNASKDNVKQAVYRRWGFYTPNDNVADAVAIAKYGRAWSVKRMPLDVEAVATYPDNDMETTICKQLQINL